MIISHKYEDLLKKRKNLIFIDVRTPKEYKEAHIPNALNIPVFNDSEHKIVGTLYKNTGKKEAIKEALKIVGPKILDLYLEFEKHQNKNYQIVVYCARGGMRSATITALLKELSIPLIKLESGYKGYRQYVNENFPLFIKEFEIVTLYGKTGVGKTNILKKIKQMGYDILDLEACANNRGSLLGAVGLKEKYSQKYFESLVFESFLNAKSKVIVTEGESRRIGNIVMPGYLYDALINSRKLYIESDIENRIKTIKKEYIKDEYDINEIIEALDKLRKYISGKDIDEYISYIHNNKYEVVIKGLVEKYYDKVYNSKGKIYEKIFNSNDEDKCAEEIVKYLFVK